MQNENLNSKNLYCTIEFVVKFQEEFDWANVSATVKLQELTVIKNYSQFELKLCFIQP